LYLPNISCIFAFLLGCYVLLAAALSSAAPAAEGSSSPTAACIEISGAGPQSAAATPTSPTAAARSTVDEAVKIKFLRIPQFEQVSLMQPLSGHDLCVCVLWQLVVQR
jgi:hypothetical protein